jgi:predicted branched-subunit amino acid permease
VSGLNSVLKPPATKFWQHPEFTQGARDMLPVAPGIAAWGLMTGVAMMKAGLSLVESLAMSLLVFAGSSQLAAMPLILAGAPVWVILATAFCVNLRFVVFSLHLRPFMMHLPLWRRLLGGYLCADLSYVLFTRRYPHAAPEDSNTTKIIANYQGNIPTNGHFSFQNSTQSTAEQIQQAQLRNAQLRQSQQAYLLGNCIVNWLSWVLPSVVGVLLANFIPQHWGLRLCGHFGAGGHCVFARVQQAAHGLSADCGRSGCGGVCVAAALEHPRGHCGSGGGLPEPGAVSHASRESDIVKETV